MASPLSWIRKYQKSLMAFFGIILIGIFTITLVLPNGGNVGPVLTRQEDPVVVRWKDGQLKASELAELRIRHFQTMNFMEGLFNYAGEKKQAPITPRVDIITRIDQADPGNVELAEENIANRYLLSQEAVRQGIVVSDAAIDDYLSLLVDNVPLTPAEMNAVNRGVNERTEYRQIRESLRMELAARQMEVFISPGLNFPMNPTQAAQYFTRTSRLIECEVLPYKVEDYLAKVTATPRSEELQKLYGEGRARFPDPTSPQPAFKNERKIKLQYFVADYEAFLTNEINKLTDDEVQAEYDRRLKANDMSIMEEVKAEETPLPGDPGSQPPPATEPAPNPDNKDGQPTPSSEPAAEAKPADSAPPAEQPAAPPAGDGEKKDGLSTWNANEATFVSFRKETQEDAGKQEPAKQDPPAEQPAPAPAEPVAEKPQEPAPSTDNPPPAAAQDPAAPAAAAPAAAAAEGQATPEGQATDQPAPPQQPAPPVMRPKPLKDVADQLKRSMKATAAEEAMNNAVDEADSAVREYQSELRDWEVTPEKERGTKPTFDPAAIAKRLNLQFVETELQTIRQLADSPTGKITHYVRTQTNFAPESVVQYVAPRFSQLQPFESFTFRDIFSANEKGLQRSTNVFWSVEKVEAKIPTFEEAKPDIEKYWKYQQAVELAKGDAEKAAAEVNSSGKKLSEIFGDKAIPTGQFPWFSAGLGSFGYFDIPGVSKPGEEFMSTAFSLQPGKAGIAVNNDRSQVYVIRLTSDDTRSTTDMMKQFAESLTPQKPYPQSLDSVSTNYLRRSFSEWQDQFLQTQKIEWLNR
ncbi:MAG: hypothetical protein ACK493_17155 [Planctomycetota bacterium]